MPLLDFVGWTNKKAPKKRTDPTFSIGDPALAAFLGLGLSSSAGVPVTEHSSLGLTAVYRAVSLIAGTIAALPMKAFRTLPDGERERVSSFLDTPGGPGGMTAFAWKELLMVHLLLHGNFYGLNMYNGAGALIGLQPIHPKLVSVKADPMAPGGKLFTVPTTSGGRRDLTTADVTHIMALGTDGLQGLSPLELARNALGSAIAADNSAARMFSNGLLLGGIVTTDETLDEEQAEQLKSGLKAKLSGSNNAGDIAVVTANVKFQPWTMSAKDAQFFESRAYQVEEVSRIYGVPPHLLGQLEKQTSWGTGVSEQNLALSRYTLMPWTSRVEEQLSLLLPRPRFVEFDFAGLLAPTPTEVTNNLIAEVAGGLMTPNEARRLQNRPPLPGGDELRVPAPPAITPTVEGKP